MKSIKDELTEHPFFEGLSEDYIELIAGCGKNVQFKEGEYLFKQGEAAESFFVIRKGNVAIEVHSPEKGALTIQTEGAGEVIGASWIFEPYRWLMDARATEPVRAVSLDGTCLRTKCEADTALGYALVLRFSQIIIERLQNTRLRLLDLYGSEVQKVG